MVTVLGDLVGKSPEEIDGKWELLECESWLVIEHLEQLTIDLRSNVGQGIIPCYTAGKWLQPVRHVIIPRPGTTVAQLIADWEEGHWIKGVPIDVEQDQGTKTHELSKWIISQEVLGSSMQLLLTLDGTESTEEPVCLQMDPDEIMDWYIDTELQDIPEGI